MEATRGLCSTDRLGHFSVCFLLVMDRTGYLCAALYEPAPYLHGQSRRMNSLRHLRCHLWQALPGPDRQRSSEAIEAYRAGTIPLMAPVSL